MIMRARRGGCVKTEIAMPNSVLASRISCNVYNRLCWAYPPDIPTKVRAQYRHLPARKVVMTHDKSQTARKDLELSGEDVEIAGIIKDMNVERCTVSK
jgi:hypothetical protein